MKPMLWIVMALMGTACAEPPPRRTTEETRAMVRQIVAEADRECATMGVVPDTPGYDSCLRRISTYRLDQVLRAEEAQAAAYADNQARWAAAAAVLAGGMASAAASYATPPAPVYQPPVRTSCRRTTTGGIDCLSY